MWKGLVLRRRKLGMSSVREICAKSRTGLAGWRNDEPQPEGEFDITIRWGCTANAPTKRVMNTATAIHHVNDKAGFRKILDDHGLCPTTWWAGNYPTVAEWPEAGLVVRPQHHAQGRNLYHVKNMAELEDAIRKCGVGWYASVLFPKTHEYRVCFVQGRVAWVAKKTPGNPEDIAWNVARGGKFENVRWSDWPIPVVKMAQEAFDLTALDFGGVDVMWDANTERAAILEINSAPSLTSPYRQECMAKCFDYIMEHEDKGRFPVQVGAKTWKAFIHPALAPDVQVRKKAA